MPELTMTPEVKARLAAALPSGYALEDFRILDVEGEISEAKPADKEAAAVIAAVTAGPAMVNEAGKPTIMKVVAWMCHADLVNLNGHSFVASELAQVAPTLFQAPNFGVMDWNHSAILNWNDDPAMIGVWYNAEYAWDQKANKGVGAFGIRVTGMMFSWLFPTQANEMLADQVRDGVVRFSMACIPRSEEFATVQGQPAVILHDPVFFTNSALNVPNADPDASGKVTEDTTVSSGDLLEQLAGPANTTQLFMLPASKDTPGAVMATDGLGNQLYYVQVAGLQNPKTIVTTASSGGTTTGNLSSGTLVLTVDGKEWSLINNGDLTQVTADTEDDLMDQEKIAELEARIVALEAVEVALKATETTLATQIETLTTEHAAAMATVHAEIEISRTALDELKTTADALQLALTEAQGVIEARDAALAASEEKLAEYVAKETASTAAATLAARMAELPAMYLTAHEKREEGVRSRIEAAWTALSDEEWELKKVELFGGFSAKVGFVARSQDLGKLPVVGAGDESDLKTQVKSLIKSK